MSAPRGGPEFLALSPPRSTARPPIGASDAPHGRRAGLARSVAIFKEASNNQVYNQTVQADGAAPSVAYELIGSSGNLIEDSRALSAFAVHIRATADRPTTSSRASRCRTRSAAPWTRPRACRSPARRARRSAAASRAVAL